MNSEFWERNIHELNNSYLSILFVCQIFEMRAFHVGSSTYVHDANKISLEISALPQRARFFDLPGDLAGV